MSRMFMFVRLQAQGGGVCAVCVRPSPVRVTAVRHWCVSLLSVTAVRHCCPYLIPGLYPRVLTIIVKPGITWNNQDLMRKEGKEHILHFLLFLLKVHRE